MRPSAQAPVGILADSRVTDPARTNPCPSSSPRPGATSSSITSTARRICSSPPTIPRPGSGIRPSLGVRQAAGGAQPGSGCGTARHRAAALPGVLQADHELPRTRRRQPHPAVGRGLRTPSHRRAFLDDAARGPRTSRPTWRWWTASRSGGGMRRASPPARACSTAGPSTPPPIRRSRRPAGPGSADISRATPASSTWRPSAAPSSRRTCGCPTSGPTSTARAGSRPSSASIATALALCRPRSPRRLQHRAVRAAGAGATGIRRRRSCRR